ncbi:hypothetical protein Glove_176g34 [Diversispora epigaea]|uniref:Uncharacterized protein n=1 Tax=Diversispora epigaea TaxID=1348612 RepID=A0A397INN2_9GLOM|nr:hypothetical protein Glove_176g34 [Diversispora epigaea]
MPCYADEKEDTKLLVVWALGSYPAGRDDYDIEMTLFAPVNMDDRDNETQAIFKKDNFFSVGGKIMMVSTSTHVTLLTKVVEFHEGILGRDSSRDSK